MLSRAWNRLASDLRRTVVGFTCKACSHRSHHAVSRGSLERGVVVIECPGCAGRHLVADHLNWFDTGLRSILPPPKDRAGP